MSRRDSSVHFDRICCPMDALPQGAVAFAHALKLAVAGKGGLTILHAGRARAGDPHEDFVRVQETLVRWNLLVNESATDAIPNLGLDVQKVIALDSDAARSTVRYLARHPHDLTVLATHQQEGLQRWISPEIAQSLAQSSGGMTLFLPQQTQGIVSLETGAVSLSSILVPVDALPDPRSAVDAALAVMQALGVLTLKSRCFTLVAGSTLPTSVVPNQVRRSGAGLFVKARLTPRFYGLQGSITPISS